MTPATPAVKALERRQVGVDGVARVADELALREPGVPAALGRAGAGEGLTTQATLVGPRAVPWSPFT